MDFDRRLAPHNIGMVQTEDFDSIGLEPTPANDQRVSLYLSGFDGDDNVTVGYTDEEPEAATSWFYTICFVVFFFLIVCVSLVARDGIPYCCRILYHYSQHPLSMQGANEPEENLTEEQRRERQVEKQRQERRLWYSYYLKPYLTVCNVGRRVEFVWHDISNASILLFSFRS